MRVLNQIIIIIGFVMIVGVPYSVYSGSFFFFVMGCLGFAVMMYGLLKEAK